MRKQILNPGTLEIDGRKYQAVFDFEAIAEAEDITDKPLLTGLTRRQVNHPTINFVRAMLFAALRRHHPEISFEQAAAMVRRDNIGELWGDLLNCWVDARQQEDGGAADPTQAPEGQS